MEAEQLLTIADAVVVAQKGRHLSDLETTILRGAIANQTYEEIAEQSGYSISHVKRNIGPRLWQLLSQGLNEEVSKTNFRTALKRRASQAETDRQSANSVVNQLAGQATAAEAARKTPLPIQQAPSFFPASLPQIDRSELQISDSSQTAQALIAASQGSDEVIDRPDIAPVTAEASKDTNSLPASYSEIYVERPPIELICYETLLQPGSLVRVKAPALMGKTSLINRVLDQIGQEGHRVVNLSFDLADEIVHLNDTNKFLRWFCIIVSRELGLANQIDEYWDEVELGTKISCTSYIEKYLLPQTNASIVLSLDDVDVLFPYPQISDAFFSLLRSWHEKAKSRPIWKQLRLLLAHTTDVYARLDINQSPFNVGVPISLSDFTAEQVQTLAQQFNVEGRIPAIAPVVDMVGGHPYLLEQAFTHLKNHPQVSLAQLLAAAPTEAGIYYHHLRDHWLTLQRHPDLMQALRAIVASPKPVAIDPNTTYQLQCMGLVKFIGNQVTARCNLYQQYFATVLA